MNVFQDRAESLLQGSTKGTKQDPLIRHFGKATVVFTPGSKPRLYVQSHDVYGFQRELIVSEANYVIYQHPGRRHEAVVSPYVAKGFIERFMHLCDHHPTLLFGGNPADRGFVILAELLHRGQALSKKLI